MKKVLYITYDGLTDPLGQSQILPYLSYLSKQGFQFTILSFEKRDRFKKEKNIVQAIADKEGIKWEPQFFTVRPPVLSKMYDRFVMMQKAKALYKKERFDIIHCRSYVAAEVGLYFKKKYGTLFLFDMRGFWADEKVDNGQWSLKKYLARNIYRHYKNIEQQFLLSADGIISLTQAAKDYIISQEKYKSVEIEVIPCCADLNHFNFNKISETAINETRKRLGIQPHQKVITYLGSVGGWYMVKEMFAFFKFLIERDNDYIMLFLTKDDEQKVKAEAVNAEVSPEKIIVTYSPRDELPSFLSISAFSIFFIRNTFSKKASSPTKHAELMGMGIPVLCNDIGDTGNIINETQTGIIINEFNEENFEAAVKQLPSLEKINKDLIRSCATKYFDLQAGAEKYLKVYNKMISKKQSVS